MGSPAFLGYQPGPIAHKLIKRPTRRLALYGVLFVVAVFLFYNAQPQSFRDQVWARLKAVVEYSVGYTRYNFKPTLFEQQCFDGSVEPINAHNLTDAIPEIIHFIWHGNSEISFKLYLAIRAALISTGINTVHLHHDRPLNSENAWLHLLQPNLTLVPFETSDYLTEVAAYHPETWKGSHQTDAMRLHLMLEQGGIYLDSDAYILRPLTNLLIGARDVYMGYEGGNRGGLCDGVIIAKAGAPFIARWLGEYATFDDRVWNYHSVVLPAKLAASHLDEICTLSPSAFFWPMWTKTAVDWMHEPLDGEEAAAVEGEIEKNGGGLFPDQLIYHAWAHPATIDKQVESQQGGYQLRTSHSSDLTIGNNNKPPHLSDNSISQPTRQQLPSSAHQEETDQGEAVANKQPSVSPTADATDATDATDTNPPELVAQINGASEPTTTRKPLEPVLDLHVHRTNTSQADLDEEAIILMRTIRETISNTNTLMGHLATKPGVFHPVENEVAMLDATTAYLTSILGPSAAARATPTMEQKLRRIEIQNRQDEAIKKLRRLPMREKEGEVAARAPQPEEAAATPPSISVPNPEWFEPFGYRGKVPLRDTFKRLVGNVAPGPEIFGVRHEPEPRGDVRMRLRRCLEMEQQGGTTREAQREEVARSPAGVSGRSEPFDFGGSASLNAYLRRIMANKGGSQGGSQGGCGPNHEQQAGPVEKAEPDQGAEVEVDDSGLDGVGWLYEVD